MFSKSQLKLITSLAQKKYREKHRLFFVEGKKAISELLKSSLELHSLYTTDLCFVAEKEKTFLIGEGDLKKISKLTTPQVALAIFHIPVPKQPELSDLTIALDGIRDPGNLGTIIRLCDWFGVSHLVCSRDTVDCYNPKVVQATMGSISRVNILYTELPEFLTNAQEELPVYAAFMDGANIYSRELTNGILVMGNEANGVSDEVASLVSQKVAIPQFGEGAETESLNVATATAILLSEFRRRTGR